MASGRLFKRGSIWWIQYSANARQYRESAKTTIKEKAQALLREWGEQGWCHPL
jgi:hypothetical protein